MPRDKEKHKESMRRWRQAHPTYQQEWNKKNQEKRLEINRRADTKRHNRRKDAGLCPRCGAERESTNLVYCDKCRVYSAKYEIKRWAENSDYFRTWVKSNPEKVREYGRRWSKSHPEKTRAKNHRRRARINGNEGSYTTAEEMELFAWQDGRCHYCGAFLYSFYPQKYHIDHKTPISRGGSNFIENIALSCPRCNEMKSNKTEEEYFTLIHSPVDRQ